MYSMLKVLKVSRDIRLFDVLPHVLLFHSMKNRRTSTFIHVGEKNQSDDAEGILWLSSHHSQLEFQFVDK